MSERTDGDRIIVTGYSGGSHFPRTQAATQQRFQADGLSKQGPFHIAGAVYGRELSFRGPGAVAGPVLGRGDIGLENPSPQPQQFMAGLHANGHIGTRSLARSLRQSLPSSAGLARFAVRGNVVGEHVSLEDAVVFGNIHGRQVRLTGCIVLGQVIAREKLYVTASTLLGYEAPEVAFAGPCAMLFAMGTGENPCSFEPFLDSAGETWPCDVRYYPVLRAQGAATLSNRPWERTSGDETGQLVASDWVRVPVQSKVYRQRDGKMVEETVAAERFVLSLAGRALNLAILQPHVDALTMMLRTALEFDHYHPTTQQQVRQKWAQALTPDELWLLSLVTEVPETVGASPRARATA